MNDLVDVAVADLETDWSRRLVATMELDGRDVLVHPLHGTLREMKTLGASWDVKRSCWKLPAISMSVHAVEDLLGDGVQNLIPGGDLVPLPAQVPDDRLFKFQRVAAGRLVVAPRGQLLVMSPGLGKTATAILAAEHSVPEGQVVVVAPSKLLRTWQRQIVQWANGDPSSSIMHGGEPDWDEVDRSRWLLTSWDVLANHQDWFEGRWPLFILDESVLAKSRKSTRSMAMRGGTRKGRRKADGSTTDDKRWENLRKSVDLIWLLSGSPTTRYYDDLWAQLNMIDPRSFRSYWRFAERYCVVEETVWAKTVVGDRRDRDPVKDNADLIYVVNQEDVLELPEYLFESVDVTLTPKQASAYEEMERDFMLELDSGEMFVVDNRMAQLTALQQMTSFWKGESAKHDALVSLIEGGAYEGPHLIWTHWREGAEALTERLSKILKVGHVSGGMTARRSDAIVQDYETGRIEALVISLGTGKFGHTLTNTATVHYVDKTYNADDYHQSLRRVRRIGLRHRPVLVTYRAPGTTDELVELNLEGKVEGISRVTNARLKELILGLGR